MRALPVLALTSMTAMVGLSTAVVVAPHHGRGLESLVRTVYVTVTDGQGVPVPDLTPADFTVKEGGREREVLKAQPSAEMAFRLNVCPKRRGVSQRPPSLIPDR